ncbi:hypothetical protein GIB67_032404 [Kingdonia uniflora]|uniref:F-box domain-containing protein n=1 Tax=Kingdonia uniflora TaxID=39325 RepID=A0A7J7MIZ6_9MAGN|nr:hypothetical protein GIB67_032404 [Kingdonia uniflora]
MATETNPDRISNLPEDILHRIVSRLPVKEAVSTSLLSTKWRHRWKFIDAMDFDEEKDFRISNGRFRSFINRTLDLHHSCVNLEKFRVCMKPDPRIRYIIVYRQLVPAFSQLVQDDIIRWINSAVERKVHDFDLTCCIGYDSNNSYRAINLLYSLPSSLFGARSITSLRLSRVKVGELNGDVSLDSLKTMSLKDVCVSTQTMGRVVSGSLVLEILYLEDCKLLSALEGRHIGLRSIHIEFCQDLVKFDMDVPNLQTFECIISTTLKFEIQGAKSLGSVQNLLLGEPLFRESFFGWMFRPASFRVSRLLKTLNLTGFTITEETLQFMISSCHLLEDLIMVRCATPRYIYLFSKSLKSLGLNDCQNLEGIEIDATNLVFFNYSGGMVNVSRMNSSCKVEAQIKLKDTSLTRCAKQWSHKLRELLAMFNHAKILKLQVSEHPDMILLGGELGYVIPPLYHLKHFEFQVVWYATGSYTDLLVRLLSLSAHLEILVISLGTFNIILKFKPEEPVELEDVLSQDWTYLPLDYLRRRLKEVEVRKIEAKDTRAVELVKFILGDAMDSETISPSSCFCWKALT